MLSAAWCVCALFAVTAARVYTRCELADELTSFGIRKEDIATWVCIAFHESRLDTAQWNHGSGDHGLLQISELYWCGPGKACGLSCEQLRDEDIADDVRCALHVHEEHTRLQGDGFLAWVVYPQHCRHNVKKYLVDCEGTPKDIDKSRSEFVFGAKNESQIDEARTPYLKIKSVFRSGYHQNFKFIENNSTSPYRWLDFKVPDIDSLKLPVFEKTQKQPVAFNSFPVTTIKPATTKKTYATIIRTTQTSPSPVSTEFSIRHTPITPKTPKIYSTTIAPHNVGFSSKIDFVSFVDTPKPTTAKSLSILRTTTKPPNKFAGFTSKSVFTNKPTTFTWKYPIITPRTTNKVTDYNTAFSRQHFDAFTARPKVTTAKYFPTTNSTRANVFTTRRYSHDLNNLSVSRSKSPATFSYFGSTTRSPTFASYTSNNKFKVTTSTPFFTTRVNKVDDEKSTTKFNIFDFYLRRMSPTSSTKSFSSFPKTQVNVFGSTSLPKFQRAELKKSTGRAGRNQFRREAEQVSDAL